jgi:hypothetical protein
MTRSFTDEINETRAILSNVWASLPDTLRGPTQFLGRHYIGCGATIGVMPRCDFACTACYLGKRSNGRNPIPMAEAKAQIRILRRWLGPAGNLQLTDGEITLLPEAELIDLVAYARKVGLVPMIMTHGETFRRKPVFLERLMREGGLTEVCFHIDTTMCGRRDHYTNAATETALNGLRAEFAEIIRAARRRTGLRLEAASTVTVTRLNLEQIPAIVSWFLANADAFKMVSFQPVAAVGRTEPSLVGPAPDEVWSRIAKGAGDPHLLRGEGWLGHPACGRFVQGMAVKRKNKDILVPLYRRDDPKDMRFLRKLLDRIGGASFRLDTRWRAIDRMVHLFGSNIPFLIKHGVPYLWRLARRAGTLRARYFCIVSHHFMNDAQLTSPEGMERRSACVFRVPIDGRLEPMCKVNAVGLRARFYQTMEKVASPRHAAS